MKTLGLIGGMSWESTIPYYRHINETVRAQLGGLHSAKVVLHSVDFQEIELLMRANNWQQIGQQLFIVGQQISHCEPILLFRMPGMKKAVIETPDHPRAPQRPDICWR